MKPSGAFTASLLLLLLLVTSAGSAVADSAIQLGAFSTQERAERFLNRVKRTRTVEMSSAPVEFRVQPLKTRSRQLYAVWLTGYRSRTEAQADLLRFRQSGLEGFIIDRVASPATARPETPAATPSPVAPAGPSTAAEADIEASQSEQAEAPSSRWAGYHTDLSGFAGAEYRYFPKSGSFDGQENSGGSLVLQPEFYMEWDDGDQSLLFVPFGRFDQHDGRSTHADVRELLWLKASGDWELRAGVGKVFWGVTESQHVVDIINQTDLVENPDREDKLGQPMVNITWIQDWGTMDVFVMPYFRERTFPGREGRFRGPVPIDIHNPVYDASNDEWHTDLAARYSHAIGDWDVGLSHFWGTSRDPVFESSLSNTGNLQIRPRYDIIHQTGVDAQATLGDWLWKLEMIRRTGQSNAFVSLTGGFEYTRVGLFETDIDLGFLAEYLYDERDDPVLNPLQDDVFVGLRWAFNDVQSTEILMGVIADRTDAGEVYNVEASRRLGDRWKLTLELRAWQDFETGSRQNAFRNDDHLLIALDRYF